MGYFPLRYDSRVVIYECKMFVRLATGCSSPSTEEIRGQSDCLQATRYLTVFLCWKITFSEHDLSTLPSVEVCFRPFLNLSPSNFCKVKQRDMQVVTWLSQKQFRFFQSFSMPSGPLFCRPVVWQVSRFGQNFPVA